MKQLNSRPIDTVDLLSLPAFVVTGTTEEEMAESAKGVRRQIAFYGSTPAYRPVLELHGWGGLQDELNALSKQGDWTGMAARISDDVLHTIAVPGTPEEVAAEVVRRYGDSADRVCLYFPGYDISDEVIGETVAAVHAASGEPS